MQGKSTRVIAAPELARTLGGYRDILIDLGTGDGRFVLHAAQQDPVLFAIGVDACRENLRDVTRAAAANTLFAIANVTEQRCTLFDEMRGLATRVTINFPWGSLRDGFLTGNPALLDGLWTMMRPGARLEVRLNASALAEAGWDLHSGGRQAAESLASAGLQVRASQMLSAAELRLLPSTWARRLAFGRDPQTILIWAQKAGATNRFSSHPAMVILGH
jgi:hypothetical protein